MAGAGTRFDPARPATEQANANALEIADSGIRHSTERRQQGERTGMTHALSKYVPALALLGGLLGTVACTDLTEVPFTEITESNFNPTESDLASIVAPPYSRLRYFMGWYGYIDGQGETGDILITPVRPNGWYDGGVYIRLHEHRWATNEGQPRSLWNAAYNVITDVNRVSYQIESGVVPVEGDTKADLLAELRALRAFAYWMLLDNHGNVAIVTDFSDTTVPQQSTRQEVYDFVVSELTEVIPQLSEEAGQAMYGRMNKWAALSILARTYLNAEVYTGTPQWDKVIETTQQIIASGKYSLDSDYRGVFARDNHTSPEIVFGVPYDMIYGGGSNFHMKTLKPDLRYVFGLTGAPWGGSASNPQFIDTYDPDDGRLQDTWLMGPQFDGQGRGYDFVQHVPSITGTAFNNGFPVWKYEIYQGLTGSSDVDYPIVRYAEILMMRAEALLRTGQGAAAAQLVTEVRQRNFTGDAAGKATVTAAQLMQGSSYNYGWYDTDGVVKTGPGGAPVTGGGADIEYGRFLDELGWEFAAEGHRRMQLIRFGVFTTKTWFNHNPNGDHRTIFGIHTSTLETNPNYVQNPGY
jgi:starch-binding outer membrane protein, SusD/RagB family